MNNRQTAVTLCNMCMIYDKSKEQVLVLDKQKKNNNWYGKTFPGGHVEIKESIMASTIREVKEETGLLVSNLSLCGVVNWDNVEYPERLIIFLYRTSEYHGEVKESIEGSLSWMKVADFKRSQKAPDMDAYLKLFLHDEYVEAYGTYKQDEFSDLKVL